MRHLRSILLLALSLSVLGIGYQPVVARGAGLELADGVRIEHTGRQSEQSTPGSTGGFVSGEVFVDLNRNGIREPQEDGVMNVGISIRNKRSSLERYTLTDSGGYYLFTDLPAGDYIVTIVPPPRFHVTTESTFSVTIGVVDAPFLSTGVVMIYYFPLVLGGAPLAPGQEMP